MCIVIALFACKFSTKDKKCDRSIGGGKNLLTRLMMTLEQFTSAAEKKMKKEGFGCQTSPVEGSQEAKK